MFVNNLLQHKHLKVITFGSFFFLAFNLDVALYFFDN